MEVSKDMPVKRVLTFPLVVFLYATLLLVTPSEAALMLAPFISGVVAGLLFAKLDCGARCVFIISFAGGLSGALVVPFYLGSLGLHLRVAGEFLTTPVAASLFFYHGLATALLAYLSHAFYTASREPASPPPSQGD